MAKLNETQPMAKTKTKPMTKTKSKPPFHLNSESARPLSVMHKYEANKRQQPRRSDCPVAKSQAYLEVGSPNRQRVTSASGKRR